MDAVEIHGLVWGCGGEDGRAAVARGIVAAEGEEPELASLDVLPPGYEGGGNLCVNRPFLIYGVDFHNACKNAVIQLLGRLAWRFDLQLQADIRRSDMKFHVIRAILRLKENLKHIAELPCLLIWSSNECEYVAVGDFSEDNEMRRRPPHTDFGWKEIRLRRIQPTLLHQNWSGQGEGIWHRISLRQVFFRNAGTGNVGGCVYAHLEEELLSRIVSLRYMSLLDA